MNLKKLVIAIDGPAGSGKSTTARRVAEALQYLHIDTGAMYRAVTLGVLDEGIPISETQRIGEYAHHVDVRLVSNGTERRVFLNGQDVTAAIRTPRVTAAVSDVSKIKSVREVMVREQRKLAGEGGVVLEGRDIGTVVLPRADLKIYLVASVQERARRRKLELAAAGTELPMETLVEQLEKRDRIDSTREESPLCKASDAVELDTTSLTIEEQTAFIVDRAKVLEQRSESV